MKSRTNPPHGLRRRGYARLEAFSLVEVALAIGLLATAFIPLIALMPAGLSGFRKAIDLSVCTQIAQRVVDDARQMDFDLLIDREAFRKNPQGLVEGFTFRAPKVTEPALRYFDDEGSEVVPVTPGKLTAEERQLIVYQVNVRVMPQAPLPVSLATAESTTASSLSEAHLALVTVEVAFAPAAIPLTFSPAEPSDKTAPDRNRFASRTGLDVYTFSAYIGRAL